jgi:acyl-CoA hydrolase
MANYITTSKAPALALTPTQFSQVHFDLLQQQLRVYFNTLDTANNQVIIEDNKLNALVWLNAGTGIF